MLGYEADWNRLNKWLEGQRSTIAASTPPAVTVVGIRAQITEVEVSGIIVRSGVAVYFVLCSFVHRLVSALVQIL